MAGEGAHELMLWGGGQTASGMAGIITQADTALDELSTLGGSPGTGFSWGMVSVQFLSGTKTFFGGPAPANTATKNYNYQREIQTTNIVDRCHAAAGSSRAGKDPIKVYLHHKVCQTTEPPEGAPIRPWFDDAAWLEYCERLRLLAAFGRYEGFDGIAQDPETFKTGAEAWRWDYAGNPGEDAVRNKVAQRGAQMMAAYLAGWGDDETLDLFCYHPFCPGGWQQTSSQLDTCNANNRKAEDSTEWNWLGGQTSTEGYGKFRYSTAQFQKTYGFGTSTGGTPARWANAMKFEINHALSTASKYDPADPDKDGGLYRGWHNWDYAWERFKWLPFVWADEPSAGGTPMSWSPFEDKDTPSVLQTEMLEKRKWGMGMVPNFDFSGFSVSDSFYGQSWHWDGTPPPPPNNDPQAYKSGFYETGFDFRPAIKAATTPGIVDTQPPVLSVPTVSATEITGTAVDHRTTVGDMDGAIKVVRWVDNQGRTGVAELDFVIDSGETSVRCDGLVHPELWIKVWHTDWTIKRSALPGATSITITAEDTHDRTHARTVTLAAGSLTPVSGPVLDLKWDTRTLWINSFAAPLEMKWDTRARVSGPVRGLKWDLRSGVYGGVLDLRWDLRKFVGRVLGSFAGVLYSVHVPVNGPSLEVVADSRGGVNGGVLDAKWDTRAVASRSHTLRWDLQVGTVLATQLELVTDLRSSVNGGVLDVKWDTRAAVSRSRTLRSDLRTTVSGPVLEAVWDLRAAAAQALTLDWDTAAAILKALGLKWDLASGGPEKRIDLDWEMFTFNQVNGVPSYLVWDLATGNASTLVLLADLRAEVDQTYDAVWDVRSAVESDETEASWDIYSEVESEAVTLAFDVAGAVNAEIGFDWDLGAGVDGGSLEMTWDMAGGPEREQSLIWDYGATVEAQVVVGWDVAAVVDGDETELVWDMQGGPELALTGAWDVSAEVESDEMRVPWTLYAAVDAPELDLPWAMPDPVDGPELVLAWEEAAAIDDDLLFQWTVLGLSHRTWEREQDTSEWETVGAGGWASSSEERWQ